MRLRRILIGATVVFVALGAWTYYLLKPDLTIRDLAKDRTAFRTNLLKQSASPQDPGHFPIPSDCQPIYYQSGDLKLRAMVSPEVHDGKHPAVVFCHGGFAMDNTDWDCTKPFRDSGYLVMVPSLRGENGNPGYFEMFYGELDDVLSAGQYMSKRADVDPDRLYVAGHSAGGTLAMLASMVPSPFKKAASFGGSPNQYTFCKASKDIVPFDMSNDKEFAVRSPFLYTGSIRIPLRMGYGEGDLIYRLYAKFMVQSAKALGKDCDTYTVPGDHYTSLPADIQQAISFFGSQENPSTKAPDPRMKRTD